MATAVVMPKQGNSVESCIIVEWKKQVGDVVSEGDTLCDVETDKTTMEVPSPVAGTLLAIFAQAGDDIPVMTNIAAIGAAGEDVSELNPNGGSGTVGQSGSGTVGSTTVQQPERAPEPQSNAQSPNLPISNLQSPISPRAKGLAERKGVEVVGLVGSGPEGRIIERDVQAALASQPKLTPLAKAMIAEGGYAAPSQGSGPGGRVTSKDLVTEEKATKSETVRQWDSQSVRQSPNLPISQSPISNLQSPPAQKVLPNAKE